jgi:tRNA(fMet)-specific endonuclease VapC
MLILDSDHLSMLERRGLEAERLERKLAESGQTVATAIVCVEEQLRGWLVRVAVARTDDALLLAYQRLHRRIAELSDMAIMPWQPAAAALFLQWRDQKVRVGTMDLRIAAIAMTNDATLLSRNLRDFGRLVGLKVENWLDG